MKLRTHSGAKKRLRPKASGKVKRKHPNMRHLLSHKKSKTKRQMGKGDYVNDSNMYQVSRLLVL